MTKPLMTKNMSTPIAPTSANCDTAPARAAPGSGTVWQSTTISAASAQALNGADAGHGRSLAIDRLRGRCGDDREKGGLGWRRNGRNRQDWREQARAREPAAGPSSFAVRLEFRSRRFVTRMAWRLL